MAAYEEYYRGKTVLITGGAGSIGVNLVQTISQLEARLVVILDDMSSAYQWNIPQLGNILTVCGSVSDDIMLKRAYMTKPDIVFHLAAYFANQNSVDYPELDLQTNGLGTLKVLQYAEMHDVDRLVYASSGCSIYGSESKMPLEEQSMSLYHTTPYQITKMLGELYCNYFNHQYKLPIVKARLFNSYGPGEVPGQYRNVIPNFLYYAMSGRPIPITGNGLDTRDFTFVDDIVDGLLRLGYEESAIGREFNIASGKETSISHLAELVNKITANSAGIVAAPTRKWDVKSRILASIALASRTVGYEPKTSFEVGLMHTYRWFQKNWDLIERDADFPPGMSAALPLDGNLYRNRDRQD